MSDETPSHRRVIEKAREEIERLTAELANCRQIIDKQYLRSMQFDTVIAERDRLTRELAQARKDHAREAHDRQTAGDAWNDMRLQRDRALTERDAARQERDAMKAMMPKPPYDADTLERAARGTYADRTVRGMARALLRLSPPSAPAQDRALDAERTQLEVDDD